LTRTPLARHRFSLEQIAFYVNELMLKSSLGQRATARVVATVAGWLGLDGPVPCATSGRIWLMRIGLYQLLRAKPVGDDWIWIVDHMVQIGQERCFVILGVRLSQLPPAGECLRREHLQLLNLLPVIKSDKRVVYEQLEQTVAQTGSVPRAILGDEGGDLQGGVEQFCQAHSAVSRLSDVAHQAARLLKARLEKDPRWQAFCTRVGQTKFQIQQTELAHLTPPSQRSKARYMNLEKLLRWGQQTLALIQQPSLAALPDAARQRYEDKLGWLREFDEPLALWSEYQAVLQQGMDLVRRQGYSRETAAQIDGVLQEQSHSTAGIELAEEFAGLIRKQSAHARAHERLPGSSEILESCLGKFKALEGEHQKGGFTRLLPALGALVGTLDAETIRTALLQVPCKKLKQWLRQHLNDTLLAKRKRAYARVKPSATKPE